MRSYVFRSLTIVFLSVFFFACQKELSFEVGDPSVGSLQGAGGECLPKQVGGTFIAGQALGDTNWIEVTVDVLQPGTYTIYTDTLNGYFFRGEGNFTDTGAVTIKLLGSGTPLTAGINDFIVNYSGTFCTIAVTVQPGTGGGTGAVFTLDGAGGACAASNVAGTYTTGTALDGSNQVVINVNVTQVGTWSVTTNTVAGITFSGSGSFTTTGPQTITLNGSGTPDTPGQQVLSVTAGGASCTFQVDVIDGGTPPPPGDYFPRTTNSNWGYEFDDNPNDTLMRVATNLTHTAAGSSFIIFAQTQDASQGFDSAGYFRKSGGNYYEWRDIGSIYGFDDPIWQEYIFLKDDQPVNTSWYSPDIVGEISGQPFTIREKFIIKQKDVTITVNGTAYPNTIEVEQRLEQFNGTTWTDITTSVGMGKWFYSRDIGLISFEFTSPNGNTKMEIFRSQVF